jgi:hypothetical protein
MTPIKRSRRLQAGLAGLSVVSALGAAVGLGLTTHTNSSSPSDDAGASGTSGRSTSSHVGDDTSRIGDDDEGRSEGASSQEGSQQGSQQGSPVTPPSSAAPQATTSGS